MRIQRQFQIALTLLALASTASVAGRETFTNADVMKMVSSGLPASVIVTKIKSVPGKYDVSTETLIALNKAGVPGAVLVAMLETGVVDSIGLSEDSVDPGVPHYPGVYMLSSTEQRMIRIAATVSDRSTAGANIGYLLSGGLLTSSVKASVSGKNATVQSMNRKPVFYMFFDESVPRAVAVGSTSVWQANNGFLTTSPAELSLVRFRDKNSNRDARVGSQSVMGTKQGVRAADRIAFDSEQVRPGVFRVTPRRPLEAGEYGFVQTLQGGKLNGNAGSTAVRVYDFGVFE